MDDHYEILQWNIRGFSANFQELQLLCSQHKPLVVCLQETQHRKDTVVSLGNFSVLSAPAQPTDDGGLTGGVGLFVHQSLLHSPVELDTTLQAVAAKVSLHKTVTICSLYLPPSSRVKEQVLVHQIKQLPRLFLLLGDLNGHSLIWGSDHFSTKGILVEEAISELNLCCLNKMGL